MNEEIDNKVYIPSDEEIREAEEKIMLSEEEYRRKLSEIKKGKIFTEEHRRNLSKALKGREGTFKGKHHTEEVKLKIRESGTLFQKGQVPWNKGIPRTEEEKKKIGEAHKGKHASEETKRKMSEVRRGEKHPRYGKHHTKEARRKMSEALKGTPSWNKGIPWDEEYKIRRRESMSKYKPSKLETSVRNELIRLGVPIPPAPRGVSEIELGKFKGHCYDFVIEFKKTIIEVNGCWQHGCQVCKVKIDTERLRQNVERDQTIREAIPKAGWVLVELWQHEINSDMTIEYLLRTKAPQLFT